MKDTMLQDEAYGARNKANCSVSLTEQARRAFPRACCQLEKVLDRELGRDPENLSCEGRDTLVDNILQLLDMGRVIELKSDIRDLDSKIHSEMARLAGLRRELITRPGLVWRLKDQRKRLERKIDGRKNRIAGLKQLRREKIDAIVSEGRAIGISLERDQVEMFLSSVTGETVLHLANLFDNVKQIAQQLRALADESGEDVQTARRYYGMHVMLVLVLARAHNIALDNIEDHQERISEIRDDNRQLNERARSMKAWIRDPEDRALLKSNISAQGITDEACAIHLEQLREQTRRFEQALDRLRERYMVAYNTLRTASLAAAVSDIVAAEINTMTTLASMKLPEIAHFRNDMLREKYIEVAKRAREGT